MAHDPSVDLWPAMCAVRAHGPGAAPSSVKAFWHGGSSEDDDVAKQEGASGRVKHGEGRKSELRLRNPMALLVVLPLSLSLSLS